MAIYGITDEGFVMKPREVILAELIVSFTTAHGDTFDTDPSSPDGQHIGIIADAIYESWLREEASYNQFIPSKVFGQRLDDLVEFNGVRRIRDKATEAVVSLDGLVGLSVPAGSIVKTEDGIKFATKNTVQLPALVTVVCTELGAIRVGALEINVIDTASAIEGWTSVSNAEAAITGIVRQTDPELKVTRSKSTISRGTSDVDAIYQALAVLNLNQVFILDNDTSLVLGTGQPANSINVVVEGGNVLDIAKAIFDNKTGGVPAWGTVNTTVLDKKGHPHNIGISRPTRVPLGLEVTIARRSDAPSNAKDLIKAALVREVNDYGLGVDAAWSAVIGTIVGIQGITVTAIKIGLKGGTLAQDTVNIANDSRATLALEDINIIG